MSTKLLLSEFERVVDGPEAVSQLRRFLVSLAVTGRLTKQYASEEPAIERSSKYIESSFRKANWPSNWIWAPIGDLIELTYGKGLPASEREDQGRVAVYGSNGVVSWTHQALTEEPAIIVGRKGSAGALAVSEGPSWTTDVAYYIVPPPFLKIGFLYRALQALHLESLGKGVKPGLSRADVYPLLLGVPPLAEQDRIAAKVDELITLCNELDTAQDIREYRRDILRGVLLQRLTSPDRRDEDIQFYLEQSPRLITKPEHIATIRRSILDLAVRGCLVPQDPGDEPSFESLRRISPTHTGRQISSPEDWIVRTEHVAFGVPSGWVWVRFGRLIAASDAGWSPRTEIFARIGDNWGVLKVSAVSWDAFRPEENKQLLPELSPRLEAQVHAGDFLISRANTSELVAKAVVVPEAPPNLMLSDKIVRLKLVDDCNPRFLLLVNNHADYARRYYAQEASGASPSMKNVSRDVIYELPIPFPPLAEQDRIVTKVDELMSICDDLEDALNKTQTRRAQLLEALLRSALKDDDNHALA